MKIKRTRGSCASTLSLPPSHTHTQWTLLAVDVILANNHNKAEQGPCQIDVSVIDTATDTDTAADTGADTDTLLLIRSQTEILRYRYSRR